LSSKSEKGRFRIPVFSDRVLDPGAAAVAKLEGGDLIKRPV